MDKHLHKAGMYESWRNSNEINYQEQLLQLFVHHQYHWLSLVTYPFKKIYRNYSNVPPSAGSYQRELPQAIDAWSVKKLLWRWFPKTRLRESSLSHWKETGKKHGAHARTETLGVSCSSIILHFHTGVEFHFWRGDTHIGDHHSVAFSQ